MTATKRCNACWSVENRLEAYLQNPRGRAFAERLLRTSPACTFLLRYNESLYYGPEYPDTRCQRIVGVFPSEQEAIAEAERICSTPETRREFWNSFGCPGPSKIEVGNFQVDHFRYPLLDDWTDGVPGWDYEKVLADNDVTVTWEHTETDSDGRTLEVPAGMCGWAMSWKYGCIFLGRTTEDTARQASALFVSLWLRGVSASFADKLMDGYIVYLERQENTSLTFLADIVSREGGADFFRVTRENFCTRSTIEAVERKVIDALNVQPDEEIICTFTKRKK
jgi:hypothetical protein